MIRARTIRRRLRLLMEEEEGIALPVALFTTIAAMALGGVAVMSSIDVQSGATRDNGAKSAIAAADAGANVALQRLNRYAGSLNADNPCLNSNPETGDLEPGPAPTGSEWCAETEPVAVGDATYAYRTSAIGSECAAEDELEYATCIVSTGTANGVNRRIELKLGASGLPSGGSSQAQIEKENELLEQKEHSETKLRELEEALQQAEQEGNGGGGVAGLIGKDEITVSGNGNIRVGVGTNGNLVTSGNASICGDIQVGVGKKWTKSGNAKQCSGYTFGEGTENLPEVSSFMPSDIATNNSDGRITMCNKGLPAECQKDTYTGGKWSSTSPFNPSNRSISLSGNTTLTVGGGDYWLCSLTLSGNSKLIMAAGSHVRFFFDTPEHCGTSEQISMSGNNEITSTGYKPGEGQFAMPGFYLLGSTSWVSQVDLSGNNSTTDEFVIYGPNSYINISGNATFKGIVAGKQIAMSGNGTIEQDAGFEAPPEITQGSGGSSRVEAIEEEQKTTEEELHRVEEELLQNESSSSEPGTASFHAVSYVQCSGATAPSGDAPNAGC